MKIFSAAQIKACDAYTTHATSITTLELIDRAANACAQYIIERYTSDKAFVIMCGMGNNGADGLALAHILLQHGYGVKVFVLLHKNEPSPENKILLNKLLKINARLVDYVHPDTFLTDLPEGVILVDAILGIGLSRPTTSWLADFINHINCLPNYKLAIDIPSGMPADSITNGSAAIIKANETLSFQLIKRSFLHPETEDSCGNIHYLEIGLDPTFIASTHTNYQTIEKEKLVSFLKAKHKFSFKNEHGHAFVIGGSKGMSGAVTLATKAALRSGVGLVTSIVPEHCYMPLQTNALEAMCTTSGTDVLTNITQYQNATAIGIGVGMGTSTIAANAFSQFIDDCTLPTVFDADALNILAIHNELMNKIPANSILTPHVGECERLFGKNNNSMQRVENIRMQAMRNKTCIVLKGHHTVVAGPEGECFYNLNGNAGMAKGGSGDVLTGILTGLLAQGYTSIQSALLGVFLHASAGDIAAENIGMKAMQASDIIKYLPKAWQKLSKT